MHKRLGPALAVMALAFICTIAGAGALGPEAGQYRLASIMPVKPSPPHQGKAVASLSRGKFLVAGRTMRDSRFSRAVILLTDYSINGATGLVINQPTGLKLTELLPGLRLGGGPDALTDAVYLGGPVGTNQMFFLLRSAMPPRDSIHVFGDVYVSSSVELLKEVVARPGRGALHVFAGYAGWAPLQLDREVTLGVWQVIDAAPEPIFEHDPATVWERLVYRGGGE